MATARHLSIDALISEGSAAGNLTPVIFGLEKKPIFFTTSTCENLQNKLVGSFGHIDFCQCGEHLKPN